MTIVRYRQPTPRIPRPPMVVDHTGPVCAWTGIAAASSPMQARSNPAGRFRARRTQRAGRLDGVPGAGSRRDTASPAEAPGRDRPPRGAAPRPSLARNGMASGCPAACSAPIVGPACLDGRRPRGSAAGPVVVVPARVLAMMRESGCVRNRSALLKMESQFSYMIGDVQSCNMLLSVNFNLHLFIRYI